MTKFTTRYKQLNARQREAVDTIDGPLLVVAGPGTGKTELLSMRAANILAQTDTLPASILCLTFTDSGASAMRQRLIDIIGADAYKVAIHTFHSFGTEVINQNGEYFYRGAQLQPADELAQYEILRGIFDELDYTNPLAGKHEDEYTYLRDVQSTISDLKRSGLTSDELRQVLDEAERVIDAVESDVRAVFVDRISKKTAAALAPIAQTAAALDTLPLPPAITPYMNVLSLSIAHAVDASLEQDSTKPITAWKAAWCEKNDRGDLVLRDRKAIDRLRAVAHVYYEYLRRMDAAELYDYDDMILQVVHALETHPDLAANLREKYLYIMVDEFQDTNLAQLRILLDLTAGNEQPNVMAVGDDDQGIYSFQGADVSNIHRFRHAYGQPPIIVLTDNYRSSAPILDLARRVITQGGNRLEDSIDDLSKQLTAHRKDAGKPVLTSYDTTDDERLDLARSIAAAIATGSKPSSIAVLARRHSELVELVPYLSEQGIAVNYERRDNVLDHDIIRLIEHLFLIIDAIHLGEHDRADALLPEIIGTPALGYDALDIWRLSLSAHRARAGWLETMTTTPVFIPFASWLIELAASIHDYPLEQLIDVVVGAPGAQLENDEWRMTNDGKQLATHTRDTTVEHPDSVSPVSLTYNADESFDSRSETRDSKVQHDDTGEAELGATEKKQHDDSVRVEAGVNKSIAASANQTTSSLEGSAFPAVVRQEAPADSQLAPNGYISPIYAYYFSPAKRAASPDSYLDTLEALRTVRDRLREHTAHEEPAVGNFLDFLQMHRELGSHLTAVRRRSEHLDQQINLLTAHKAKGLEFDHVYVTGLVDSTWGERVRSRSRLIRYPANLPIGAPGDSYDERIRLAYVALTRARSQLSLSFATSDTLGRDRQIASFLSDETTVDALPADTATLTTQAEIDWRGRLSRPITGDMHTLLTPTLDTYKLSATHLGNFLDVTSGGPEHFLLNNLLRFPQAKSPSASYGTAIHATLQAAHNYLAAHDGEQQPIEDIIGSFERHLGDQHLGERDHAAFLSRGIDALSAFLSANYRSFSASQRTELSFGTQDVVIDGARLTGALDLVNLDMTAKTIRVTDYKTGRASRDWRGKTEYERIKLHKYRQQLMFYQLLVENSRDFSTYQFDGGVLQFVEPTASGDIVALDQSFTTDELTEFRALIRAVWYCITTLELPDTSDYNQTLGGIQDFERNIIDRYS